jgi:phosphoglycerate dehydrogenase-like enzyme
VEIRFADPISDDETIRPRQQIKTAQVAFCTYLPKNIADMPQLEWVQLASSGYSQLKQHNLPAKKIRACNARGVFDTGIAEWNVAMMICLARNLRQLIRNQESRVWDRAAVFQTEIRGATVGLWGYGGIARQTARLCKALGLTVFTLTRSGVGPRHNAYCVPNSGDSAGTLPDRSFSLNAKEQFLSQLDFLVLCTPHTSETEGIVGAAELRMLPAHAFLLNPARGALVQEEALLQALQEHWIAGAALDTHVHDPLPPDHPLWAFENVILTPHISGSSNSPYFLSRIWDLFATNLERFLAGNELLNELSPQELAR